MTLPDIIFFVLAAAAPSAVIAWGFTYTWARNRIRDAFVCTLRAQSRVLANAESWISSSQLKDQPTISPSKEHDMKTADLSPAMIGQTIRIVRKGIAGTHNYIEGTLEDFDFNVGPVEAYGPRSVLRDFTGLKATVAGLDFNLTGSEELVASPVIHE